MIAYRDLRASDRAVLDLLAQKGDDLSLPRHTLLFFYQPKDGGSASFETIAAVASEKALTISRLDGEALILEGQLCVDPAALKALVDWALDRADEAGAVFDGWECAVATREN